MNPCSDFIGLSWRIIADARFQTVRFWKRALSFVAN
jgi:hypothetical protein